MFNFSALPRELQLLICNALFGACFESVIAKLDVSHRSKWVQTPSAEYRKALQLAKQLACTSKVFGTAYKSFRPQLRWDYHINKTLHLDYLQEYCQSSKLLPHGKADDRVEISVRVVNRTKEWEQVVASFEHLRDGRLLHFVRCHSLDGLPALRVKKRSRLDPLPYFVERKASCHERDYTGRCLIEDDCWVKLDKKGSADRGKESEGHGKDEGEWEWETVYVLV